MKPIKMAFVALVAVFALSAVAASSASASPEWYVKKAGVFKKVTTAVNVTWETVEKGKITLIDTANLIWLETPLGIECGAEGEGKIESAGAARIGTLTTKTGTCEGVVGRRERYCKEVRRVEPLSNWLSALYTEGSEVRNRFTYGGWKFTCSGTGGVQTDFCESKTSTHMTNNTSAGAVEAAFDTKSNKTNCEDGGHKEGEGAGEWKGTLRITPTASEKTAGVEAIKVE